MLSLICPECSAKNSLTAERCQECGTSLADVFPIDDRVTYSPEKDEFDLLDRAGDDLPDLLHALKQEDADSELKDTDGGIPDLPITEPDSGENVEGDLEGEEEIPEWLNRVRQRANQETDSVGEITQKISAALESLAEGKNEDQHENFESWIQSLKESAPDKSPEKDSNDADLTEETHADWLTRIRKAQGKLPDNESDDSLSESDQERDSLLQWLVALEDEPKDSTEKPVIEDPGTVLEAEDTHETPLVSKKPGDVSRAITPEDTEPVILEPPKLTVSREEKVQADQLTATIVDERSSRPVRKPKKQPSHGIARLVMGLLLIVGLSLSLFVGENANLPQGNLQSHNAEIITWAEGLPADAHLLMIFDYHPGYSSELTLLAKPIIEIAVQANHEVSILSSTPSGMLIAQQLLEDTADRIILPINDLGYFPFVAYSAYSVINWRASGWEIRNYPVPEKSLPTGDYDGVLILSDSYEGARIWIEQLTIIVPDTPIYLLVTAQAGPMLMPYYESGQVSGMVSGLSEAAGVEASLANDGGVAVRWRAYQVGLVMLIVLMSIGVIYGVDLTSDSERRGAQ